MDFGLPSVEDQYRQAARWAGLLQKADYPTELHGSGEDAPFDWEWRVFGPGWNGPQVGRRDTGIAPEHVEVQRSPRGDVKGPVRIPAGARERPRA